MVIVFDIDNTLYDFAAYFSPFFRSAVHIVAKELGLSEDVVIDDFRAIFSDVGSLEYQFLVQRSSLIRDIEPSKIDRILMLLSVAARRVRARRLCLYPGVKDTLDQLRNSGVVCAAITNAPFYQVDQRFSHLGLHRYFDALICAENVEMPEGNSSQKYEARREKIAKKYRKFVELPKDRQKPSDYGYRLIRELYDQTEEFYAVGDSLLKDLAPAAQVGFKTIWARYGTKISQADLDTLILVTPWSGAEIHAARSDTFESNWVIDEFSDLRSILGIPYQQSLF